MKIKNKITLLYTLLTGAVILTFCAFIYFFAQRNVHENFFHRLEVRSEIVAHTAITENNDKSAILTEVKDKYLKNLPFETHKKHILEVDELKDFKLNIEGLPNNFFNEAISKGKNRFLKTDTFYVATVVKNNDTAVLLVSSAIDETGLEELISLRNTILVGFCIALLIIYTLGRLFANIAFSPVKNIIKKVKEIKATNLHLRLPTNGGRDELYDLSVTFNNMLNRLETAFELQNNFISNASHELKTPLTIISGEAELALSNQDIDKNSKDSFEKIQIETEKLDGLMNSLLGLAQTGFDGKRLTFENIRIDELVLSVNITLNKIIPDNRTEINFDNLPEEEDKLLLKGIPGMLKVALLNIFINACKYSNNAPVSVTILVEGEEIVIITEDKGIGIPEEEISKIFTPFFRASNTADFKGYGVGLSLTLNIIKIHGGRINVESKAGKGTTVKIHIPYIQ